MDKKKKEDILNEWNEENWEGMCQIESLVRDEYQKGKINADEAMKKVIHILNEI